MKSNTMWCSQCQQDVPGVCSATGKTYVCPRCGVGLAVGAPGSEASGADDLLSRSGADERAAPSVGGGEGTFAEKSVRVAVKALGIDTQDFQPSAQLDAQESPAAGSRLDSSEGVLPAPTESRSAPDRTGSAGGESIGPDWTEASCDPPDRFKSDPPISVDESRSIEETPPTPPAYDSWELEEQLRHIDRILAATVLPEPKPGGRLESRRDAVQRGTKASKVGDEVGEAVGDEVGGKRRDESKNQFRLDAAHRESADRRHALAEQRRAEKRPVEHGRVEHRRTEERMASKQAAKADPQEFLYRVTWGLLSGGLTLFACGGLLLLWSAWTGRQDLWTIGWPIAMIGQISLAIGGILLADRLWHQSSSTAAKLDSVDQRLDDLGAARPDADSSPSTTTRSIHPPEDSSPRLLLADLKSQLDLLAVRLGQEADHPEVDGPVA